MRLLKPAMARVITRTTLAARDAPLCGNHVELRPPPSRTDYTFFLVNGLA